MSHPQAAVLTAVQDNEDEWQPHAAEEFQEVGTVGKIAIGLLGASTVTHLLATWSDWNTYGVVNQYLGGGLNVDDADLNRADTISRLTSIPNVVVSVAAAVVFVIWLWRARVNSEVFCQADHRRGHGWVLASWFCPGPNLVFPKQIVDDVWLASDPKTPVYADDLRRLRTPLLTKVWWCTWVGALAFDVVIRRFLMWMDPTVGTLRGIALAGTASLLLTVISAVGATLIIRKINDMQTSREWIPWWDQREPKLTAVPTYADDDTSEQPAVSEPIAAPQLRLERSPEFVAPTPAPAPAEEEAPQWSPFASVVETWQDNGGQDTQQFNAVETWQEERGPVEEATPSYQQTAAGLDAPSWSTPSSPYQPAENDVLSAPLPSWQAETVTPPSLSVVQPDPYAYQPAPTTPEFVQPAYDQPAAYDQPKPAAPEFVEPAQPSWSESYSEQPYSYQSSSDYLTSSAPIPAPEPEPAPVARAGRRAARVAVDSPSTIQPAVTSSHYQEPAQSEPDDYLTPSKPLPPVPAYEPEPTYTPEPTYSAYDAPAESPSAEPTSYGTDYGTSYQSGQTYSEYGSSPSYDSYSSTYDQSSASYGSTSYSDNGYGSETYSDYSPNYTPESYSADYSTDYGYPQEPAAPQYQQQTPYSYEPAQPPAQHQQEEPESATVPRTHPRRRWV
ncbi:uncharacterized protein DUF4328 [Kribbella amoyensis]|uniref:Uncharacterized protein DUF4328 n=1 Tax=Kribbella amoyensis TaxID=996641 RepID=A0A561BP36_9ACTN|nr:DUF4328 domain-containing protein [Kribbella amoyensis]TWD80627.1 uncharacterized protein DUF4328 [Kribbella amoyensis]